MPLALEAFPHSASGDGATKTSLVVFYVFRGDRAAVRLLSNSQTALLQQNPFCLLSFVFCLLSFVFFSQPLSFRPAYGLPDNTSQKTEKIPTGEVWGRHPERRMERDGQDEAAWMPLRERNEPGMANPR
ncbi:hypothetical protein, partial [Pantoea sp.]|uniref:hypothetical protein n=1 Tax=Pantoea sp. TaxID=69393 RepID=UPI0031CF8300